MLPAVARSLGLPTVDGEDPTGALTEHLRPLRMLVVLDNAEHLLDAGPSVAALVAACPGLTVLATSRVPLRVRGESQFQVQPLGLPAAGAADPAEVGRSDAVRLFLDRADAVRPGYVLDAANAADVGALCRRLGGIPLALELVAARSRLCAPAVLLARLDEVMAAAGARDLPPRQRTMRATIDWSHDLLEPEEQRLLRRLSVFSGGFTLEAAQEVWSAGREDAPPLLPVLEALVDHSLVLTDLDTPGTRFRMLEPILQYAATRLTGDEERITRQAHLHHFLRLAERTEPDYRSSATVEALALTETEHGNLVGALEWATTHGHADLAGRIGWAIWLYWWLRGRPGEGRHLMEGVLAQDLPDDVRVRAFAVLGAMAFAQGDLEAARCWTEGRALAAATGDTAGQAHCVAGEGLIALAQGDLETADRTLQEAVPLCDDEAVGRWLWTLTHVWRATVALLQGAPEQALPLLDVALRSARARQDRLAVYITLFTAAQVSTAAGEHAPGADPARGGHPAQPRHRGHGQPGLLPRGPRRRRARGGTARPGRRPARRRAAPARDRERQRLRLLPAGPGPARPGARRLGRSPGGRLGRGRRARPPPLPAAGRRLRRHPGRVGAKAATARRSHVAPPQASAKPTARSAALTAGATPTDAGRFTMRIRRLLAPIAAHAVALALVPALVVPAHADPRRPRRSGTTAPTTRTPWSTASRGSPRPASAPTWAGARRTGRCPRSARRSTCAATWGW